VHTRIGSFLRYWLPPIIWSSAILAASTAQFSSSNSGPWLHDLVLRVLGHDLAPHFFDLLHFGLRKAGHLTAYGILSALWFRAFRSGQALSWRPRWAAWAVALAVAVASTDEWHQSFIPSRTGTIHDVFLDAGGAILAQLLVRVAQVLLIFHP
jgi:Predicted integral membrane protein